MKIALAILSILLFGCQEKLDSTISSANFVDSKQDVGNRIEYDENSIYGIWQNDSLDTLITKYATLYLTPDSNYSWIGSAIKHPIFDDSSALYLGQAFFYCSNDQSEAYAYSVIRRDDKLYTCQLAGDNMIDKSEIYDWSELILIDNRLKFNNLSSLTFTKMSNKKLMNPFLEIISLFNHDTKYTDILLTAPKNHKLSHFENSKPE